MHRLVWTLCLLTTVAAGSTAQAPRSPWPDPVERASFQAGELARRARLTAARPEPAARTALQERYDARSYRLALDLRDVSGEWIFGRLDARMEVLEGPLDTLLLDLNEVMTVDSVFVDHVPSDFVHEGYDLRILPSHPPFGGRETAVSVFYQGHPARTGFQAFGWGSHGGATPVVWSLSEPEGAREWWPCKDRPDDKADSVEVLLQVPDWMVGTSNGVLVNQTLEDDGSRVFHWKHRYPITTYLVCATATDFDRLQDSTASVTGRTIPLEHFVYPEKLQAAQEDFSITPDAMAMLEARFGPYPFLDEKYGHTLFPWGGAMEHQTNTSYGSGLVTGAHTADWVLVHELAHQWWGDMTSPADWRDIWLNEGFASYAEALWFEHLGGAGDYRLYMENIQAVVDPSGPVYDPPALFDGNTVYNKGAWVVHMLRGVLGDSLFFSSLAEYRERTAYRSTTTAEFQSIVEEVADRDLDWYFEPWLLGHNRPAYVVSMLPFTEAGEPKVAVHIGQVQQDAPYFPMPVPLVIRLSGGVLRTTVWNDPDHEDWEFRLVRPAARVDLDPDGWILKSVSEEAYGLHITTTELPAGVQDSVYSASVSGRGGQPPYHWSVVDDLPGAIALDPETGALSGRAPEAGGYSFTLQIADADLATDTQRFQWRVGMLPDTSGSPPDTTGGVVIDTELRAHPVPASASLILELPAAPGLPVTLGVFDLQGRRVRLLYQGLGAPSRISWDGRDDRGQRVASGIYIAKAELGGIAKTRRLVWLWGER